MFSRISGKLVLTGMVTTLANQHAFEAIYMPGTFCFQGQYFAMQLPGIFGLPTGHMDHSPDLSFTTVVADQHRQQLVDIQLVCFSPPGPATDLDTGRINHQVLDAIRF